MFKIFKPEINKKISYRTGMTIPLTIEFRDKSTLCWRLQMDDVANHEKYTEKIKANYMFSKHYLNIDRNEIVTERVFQVPETGAWFGIPDWRHGIFHLYNKISKYQTIKHSDEEVGIFYNYIYHTLVVYTTNDCANTEAFVEWVFNNHSAVETYMFDLMLMHNKYMGMPFIGTPRYFYGKDAAVVILDPTDKGGGN